MEKRDILAGLDGCLRRRLTAENLVPFVCAMVFGWAAHFAVSARNLAMLDCLEWGTYHIADNWELQLGRWALHYTDTLRCGVVGTTGILLFCLLVMAGAALLVCDVFRVESLLCRGLIGTAFTVAPQLEAALLVTYCADGYCLSVLLAVLSMYLVFRAPGRVPLWQLCLAAASLTLSTGFYQCHVGVAVILALMLLYRLLRDEASWQEIGTKAAQAALVGVVGLFAYFGVAKLYHLLHGIGFSNYRGADQVGIGSILANLPGGIVTAYRYAVDYFVFDTIVHNIIWNRTKMWALLFLAVTISQAAIIFKKRLYKDLPRLTLMALCVVLLPLGLDTIALLVPGNTANLMMSMPAVLILPILLALVESGDGFGGWLKLAAAVLCGCILWTQLWQDQASYMAVEQSISQAKTVALDVYTRATQQEEYSADLPWVFIGNRNPEQDREPLGKIYYLAAGMYTDWKPIRDDFEGNANQWRGFYRTYLGLELDSLRANKLMESHPVLLEQGLIKEMPIYPSADSVQVLDGVVVVKFQQWDGESSFLR